MITSSRAISVDYGRKLTPLTQKLFNLDPVTKDFATLGDTGCKRLYGLTYYPGSANVSVSDHLRVNFLGDPAMKLSRPKKLIVIDNIDSPDPDKIRALDFVKVTGHVTKPMVLWIILLTAESPSISLIKRLLKRRLIMITCPIWPTNSLS
jgi:hypothetical protein